MLCVSKDIRPYTLVICLLIEKMYSCLVQAHYWTGYMALWLKAAGYSVALRNILPTFISLIQALSSW